MATLRFKLLPAVTLFLAAHAAHADTPAASPAPVHAAQPRTVEKGGGLGRLFAWTTLLTGITGGLASGGLVLYTQNALDQCQQDTLLGLGCAVEQRDADDAAGIATMGGVAAGGLIVTSIILFVVTDPKHTEIEYGDPPPPGLPIGGYVATGVALGAAITAHVMMSNAGDSLGDPSMHATPDETEALASRYRYARYAAGGLYGLSAGFAIMSALQTVRVVRGRGAESSTQVSVTPTRSGAMLALAGSF
jgi:hypothetical protein